MTNYSIIPYKGKNPKIAPDTFIADGARIIGDVTIEKDSSIWYNCVLRGDVNKISIGSGVNIQDGSVLHVSRTKKGYLSIENNITIGHQAIIHACTIKNGAFIGMQAMIMDGSIIEENAMVAAGSLIPPNTIVKKGELWVGRPAKFMRHLEDDDLQTMNRITKNYITLSKEHKNPSQA